jgi:hypothetical protein
VPTHLVNLDALIKREDFESGPNAVGKVGEKITFNATQLEIGAFFYSVLRKPSFQRETSNWSPNQIVEFVRSFLDGELIPSVILWRSKETNNVFLIDGSHRISALIAWVNDDYGDGAISRDFWGTVPPAQATLHRKTQELMNQIIGTYRDIRSPSSSQGIPSPLIMSRAFSASTRQPPTQSVEGDAEIAEKSFLTINSNPAIIDKNKLAIIKARRKPNAIATRALMRAGTGYPYWGKFPKAQDIATLASETYELLFGQIIDIGTRVADVPRAGQPYSAEAFTMLLDMVNIFNGVTDAMWQESKSKSKHPKQAINPLPDDSDGNATLMFIEKVQKVARLAISPETRDGSLGLDQVVYSYGENGKFYPTAFIASLKFAKELTDSERYDFLKIRLVFEDFLAENKSFAYSVEGGQ